MFLLKIFGFEALRVISVDSSRNQVFAERTGRTKYGFVGIEKCQEHILVEFLGEIG